MRTFGRLPWLSLWRSEKDLFQLAIDSFKVCVEHVIQQADLRRADWLAAQDRFGSSSKLANLVEGCRAGEESQRAD